jgi:signal transduction histidine kinase
MSRRYWPAVLAILALLLFGSYLAYTQFLVQQIRGQSVTMTNIYQSVQKGLASFGEEAQLDALLRVQEQLLLLGVPLVLTDANGTIANAVNLPFSADLTTAEGQRRAGQYVSSLRARGRFVTLPEISTIYYGYPPIVGWLQWVPWLQIGGGILLVAIAIAIIRSNVRAERERMWASMARELAHQMGTPLSSLQGWIEVLQLPPEERDGLVETNHIGDAIGTDVERLERVSRRFELIGKKPALQPTRLGVVLHDLESYFRPRLPRLGGGIDLRVRAEDDLAPIDANAVLLVWALENIVKNAIDALAGRGGRIMISALGKQDSVHIHISDNGPGIDPGVKGRIFEAGVSTKTGGWGVGLSLTQRIIEDLHGGKISVYPRRRGGTTFDIELPAAGKKLRRSLFAWR